MRRTWTQTATAPVAEDGLAWAFMSPERPRILVSNDDGHQSEGIKALAGAMGELGEVWVVAPETEQSASSHAISIHRPLRMREVRPRWYAVDGTPTDCSWLGIHHVLRDMRPARG